MQTTFDNARQREAGFGGYLFPLVAGGIILLFLAAPWSFAHKAHVALHGLCAQTPSHTFRFGSQPLPFDARMTGIYGGFIVALVYLVIAGRHRAAKLPAWGLMGLLAVLVGAMAIDGFNSLFLDLGRPHPYAPDNRLRLITGMGTGVALAVIISYLLAVTLWRRPNTDERVARWRDIAILAPLLLPFPLLVLTGATWLAVPIAFVLMISAVIVVSSLALVALVLVRRLDFTFERCADLHVVATHALVGGVAIMALLSGGRFLLERLLGLPPLT